MGDGEAQRAALPYCLALVADPRLCAPHAKSTWETVQRKAEEKAEVHIDYLGSPLCARA